MWPGDNPWGAVNRRRGPVTGQQAAQTAGELVRGGAEVQEPGQPFTRSCGGGGGGGLADLQPADLLPPYSLLVDLC